MPIIVKSRDEIRLMREAGRILAETLDIVVSHVRPGVIEKELDEIARREFKKRGVIPTFLKYGQPPYPATICVSVNDEIVHGIPGDREIADGDVVSIDIGCTHKGFVADMAVTLGAGTLTPQAQKLIEVTREALWRGISASRGAASIGEIGAAIQAWAAPSCGPAWSSRSSPWSTSATGAPNATPTIGPSAPSTAVSPPTSSTPSLSQTAKPKS